VVGTRDFDVVVTDLGLPDVSGETVIHEIVARARVRPWLIVVTAFDDSYVVAARAAGADVVLTKPVPWKTLVGALARAPRTGLAPRLGTAPGAL
jgi:DNA-binding response OmpR family regulator